MSDFSETHLVWFGLFSEFEKILQYSAAVAAWGDLLGDEAQSSKKDILFLLLSAEALQNQLTLELTKIFDKGKSCGNENCSLEMLKKLCLDDIKHFPNGEKDEYIEKLNALYEKYNNIISGEVRNKQVAHHDLETLFSGKPKFIVFSQIIDLVEDIRFVLENICERFLGVNAKFPELSKLKDKYIISLKGILDLEDVP